MKKTKNNKQSKSRSPPKHTRRNNSLSNSELLESGHAQINIVSKENNYHSFAPTQLMFQDSASLSRTDSKPKLYSTTGTDKHKTLDQRLQQFFNLTQDIERLQLNQSQEQDNFMSQIDERLQKQMHIFDLDVTIDNSMLMPNTSASSRNILKSVVQKNVSSRKFITPQTSSNRKTPYNHDLCDVAPEEDEMVQQLIEQTMFKERQHYEQALKTQHQVIFIQEQLQDIRNTVQQYLSSQIQSNQLVVNLQRQLYDDIAQYYKDLKQEHQKNLIQHGAWQDEFRQLSCKSTTRAERILELQSINQELQEEIGDCQFELKKYKNQVNMLNQAMVQYGYRVEQEGASSLESLKAVIDENERLRNEMRGLLESQIKERHLQEAKTFEALREIPSLVSLQYQQAIEEYGQRVNQESHNDRETIVSLQIEIKEKQQRIVQLIEHKTKIEDEMNQLLVQKREQSETLKNKSRKVQELELAVDVAKSAQERDSKLLNELRTKILQFEPEKFGLQQQIQELKLINSQFEQEILQAEEIRNQIQQELQRAYAESVGLKIDKEELTMEKAELVQLLQIKAQFIQRVQERGEFVDNDKQLFIEVIQKLSMHAIKRQGSVDDLTAKNVRSMMDQNSFQLFERQDSIIKQLQQDSTELLQQLIQIYQDQYNWNQLVKVMVDLIQALNQPKRDQSLVLQKIQRTETQPYLDYITKCETEFRNKIAVLESRLIAIDQLPIFSSPEKSDQIKQIHQTRVQTLEDQVSNLQNLLEQNHVSLSCLERENRNLEEENQKFRKNFQSNQSHEFKVGISQDDLIAMIECQAYALEDALTK